MRLRITALLQHRFWSAFAAPRHLLTALLQHCFWGTSAAPRLRITALLQHRFWGAFAAPRHLITPLLQHFFLGHFYSTSSSYNSAFATPFLGHLFCSTLVILTAPRQHRFRKNLRGLFLCSTPSVIDNPNVALTCACSFRFACFDSLQMAYGVAPAAC